MSIWIIEPREPLIFRDGRPFSTNPGASANSLPFPFPSTTTGGTRTQAGLDEHGIFTRSPEEMLKLKVRGPLLVQLAEHDSEPEMLEWLAPAPADALLLEPDKAQQEYDEKLGEQKKAKARLKRLIPLHVGDASTDLEGISRKAGLGAPLLLVGTPEPAEHKPLAKSQLPQYWQWRWFEKWLFEPPAEKTIYNWNELGIHGLPGEQRVHITFDKDLHAARDEALFETNGREFVVRGDEQRHLSNAHQLALAVIVGEDEPQDKELVPRADFATLGGERRIVKWRPSTAKRPECPEGLIERVAAQGACRIILLTPAYFKNGCYPEHLLQPQNGITPQLRALVVDRPQVVSGWDLAHKGSNGKPQGRPKPTRRLVPAGSVLFLKFKETGQTVEQWVKATWLQCIGDDPQHCRDGFGLAVVGTWNGESEELKGAEQA